MLKLAFKYMRYYKNQTLAILASVILTASLLSGIGSLLYSSRLSDLENAKAVYGDWHYYLEVKPELFKSIKGKEEGDGFTISQCGKMEVRDVVTEPYTIYFVYGDESYLEMSHRNLVSGRYPKGADEIAADSYTLMNLGYAGEIGENIRLGEKEYTLCGIVRNEWASDADEMYVFVGGNFVGRGSYKYIYLKFDEGKKLYRQLDAFLAKYKLSAESLELNDEVVKYLGGEKPDSIYDIIKFGLTNEEGNFTYIILKLQSEYNLAFNGMFLLLCIFSLFVIYSIFNISVSKRKSEYGMMETLGISKKSILGTLIIELWALFIIGYPLGCILGNGILNMFYRNLNGVFINNDVKEQIYEQASGNDLGFCVAWNVVIIGFIFLFAGLTFVGMLTVRSMRKQSVRQVMSGDALFIMRRRKIYSRRNCDLANVVVRKFMFSNKKKAAGILISLSIGGCIFFCTDYMVESLKVHAEMSMKSDDGLGSEYRISVKSNSLSDTISKDTINKLKGTEGLSQCYGTKYTLGEMEVRYEKYLDTYFGEMESEILTERFGGICAEKKDGVYGVKYDVYGYDEGMLEQLRDFILEGEINWEDLVGGNKIIAVANKDGQGNYYFYGKHPGDRVTIRVPKDLDCPEEVLKFRSGEEDYIEKDFEIAAIVSRTLAREDNFLNVDVWKDMPTVIMANEQMGDNYGIYDYSFVNASLMEGADSDMVAGRIMKEIKDVPKAVLQDYTAAIKTREKYLGQQQLFFSGVAVILLVISLFHIMNSMNYSIIAHKREYGIIRAMGITDGGFYRMIIRTGLLYGIMADVLIFLIYNLFLRRGMDYYLTHVVQFMHITAGIPQGVWGLVMVLNVVIAVVAVLIPARKIMGGDIIDEIR